MEENAQTPQPTIAPPLSVPPVIQTPTQKPTVYLIFFTILFLAVLSIAGYFGYQNLPAVKVDRLIKDCLSRGGALGESYPPQCFTPTPTITTTLTPTPDTANWETYKYQQLFEIKIPNDLKIIDNGRIEIGDYLSIGTYPTNPEACRGDCPIIETKVSKTINGLEVRYLTGWWGEIGGNIAQSYIEYLIPQNGKYIYLQMQELPFSTKISLVREKVGKVSEVNSKLLDQILSTFKFADKDDTKKCFSNKDCPNNSFCDYSTPGGMGPNGFVTGQPYGSQQCILKCQNNDQCPSSQCQTFEMVTGDINNRQKGCKL